jgi:hypothetical protein
VRRAILLIPYSILGRDRRHIWVALLATEWGAQSRRRSRRAFVSNAEKGDQEHFHFGGHWQFGFRV